jgi:hypothetical protein
MIVTRAGGEDADFAGVTKNISSRGVLFTAGANPNLGTAIEYTIALNLNKEETQPVKLWCIGKVIRSEQTPDHLAFHVAATLERYENGAARKDLT